MLFNYSEEELTFEINEENLGFSIAIKILISFEFLILITLGVALYLSIIEYEMNGGDPQKRSLSNKLYSLLCFELMLQMTTQITGIMLRVIFGPFHETIAALFLYIQAVLMIMLTLTLIQILLYKNLQIYRFRVSVGKNEEFWFVFAIVFNIIMSNTTIILSFGATQTRVSDYYFLIGNVLVYDIYPHIS